MLNAKSTRLIDPSKHRKRDPIVDHSRCDCGKTRELKWALFRTSAGLFHKANLVPLLSDSHASALPMFLVSAATGKYDTQDARRKSSEQSSECHSPWLETLAGLRKKNCRMLATSIIMASHFCTKPMAAGNNTMMPRWKCLSIKLLSCSKWTCMALYHGYFRNTQQWRHTSACDR